MIRRPPGSTLPYTLFPSTTLFRSVWPHMTIQENRERGAYIMPKASLVRRKLDEVYADFPVLLERRSELAGRLSGGQQQMLAIGRAIDRKSTRLNSSH